MARLLAAAPAASPAADKLRVGYVLKRYPRFSETFVVNELLAHEAAGLSLDIFALRPPSDSHFQDVISRVAAPVHYLPSDRLRVEALWESLQDGAALAPEGWSVFASAAGEATRDVYQAILLAQQVRERGIRHLHAHFATSAASVARLAARFSGVSYSLTAHAKDIFHESVQDAVLARTFGEASAVVTVSDFNQRYLRQRLGAAAAGVQRIYNGLDLNQFPFQPPCGRAPGIVAVGRLVEKKGFSMLVEACALLARRVPNLTCQIVGSGPLEAALREEIEQRGLSRVVVLRGPRPQEQVRALVQEAAVFVAPSIEAADGDRDGLPTVLIEAMALGTPCVSTRVTGIPELVRHEQTGILGPEKDASALADGIERLLADPRLGLELARRARHLIEQEFDVHRNSARLRELWRTTRRRRTSTDDQHALRDVGS